VEYHPWYPPYSWLKERFGSSLGLTPLEYSLHLLSWEFKSVSLFWLAAKEVTYHIRLSLLPLYRHRAAVVLNEEVMGCPCSGGDQSSLQGVAQVMNLDLYSSSPLYYWGVNFTYVLLVGL
jgi:hypothetical protein